VNVLGVGISVTDTDSTVAQIGRWIDSRRQHYVCVTGVHGVMESQSDDELRRIHNASGLTGPDGMPMVWAGRWSGAREIRRVRGPDLMLAVLEAAEDRGWRSFFYGGAAGVPEMLASALVDRYPRLQVAGTHSPPFRPLTAEEDAEIVRRINASRPDIVWVGLSTPKQERWMAGHIGRLEVPVMLGVGAAFDVHAGLVQEAPRWIQQSGFEWLYRLTKEPRRLWKRYLGNNPRFVASILRNPPALVADAGGDASLGTSPSGGPPDG
jgi:N-acetylglucosaminyldiphosphoundecaprenol N-acetyl-beta-D-mannosaminyltransferase